MCLEHSFKAVWNTLNCVDGHYKLRITGFNVSNVQVAQQEMPMVRIDNSKPDAYLDVSSPAATTSTIGANPMSAQNNKGFRESL